MFEWLRSQNDFMMIFVILVVGIISWILIFCMFVLYDYFRGWVIKKRKIARRKNELYRKYGNGEVRIYRDTTKRSSRR